MRVVVLSAFGVRQSLESRVQEGRFRSTMDWIDIALWLVALAALWKSGSWLWERHLVRRAVATFRRDAAWEELAVLLSRWVPEFHKHLAKGTLGEGHFLTPEFADVMERRRALRESVEIDHQIQLESVPGLLPVCRVQSGDGSEEVGVLVHVQARHLVRDLGTGEWVGGKGGARQLHEEFWVCRRDCLKGWQVSSVLPRHHAFARIRRRG